MEDSLVKASLAYRRHQQDIWNGRAPEKYTRILPYIVGHHVLEIGAAEGVLSLLMSARQLVHGVTALEQRRDRHEEGLRLQARWQGLGLDVSRCTMVHGNVLGYESFAEYDVIVAVRAVYYLREKALSVLQKAFEDDVIRVVLCGNKGRQAHYRAYPDSDLGRFNELASTEGMQSLLKQSGYHIELARDEGDPIVVGCHPYTT